MQPNDQPTSNDYGFSPNNGDYSKPAGNPSVSANPAADAIRHKIANIYSVEPDAQEEAREAAGPSVQHSRHQQYMLQLSGSGKSPDEVKAAWHEYYANLSEHEKREVWQEFYSHHGQASTARPAPAPQHQTPAVEHHTVQPAQPHHDLSHANPLTHVYHAPAAQTQAAPAPAPAARPARDSRTVADIKSQLLQRVSSRQRPKTGQNMQSMLFGLGMGALFMLIMLFGFFNERFIAPFMTPSRAISSTPIIVSNSTATDDPEPKVIIPKINVELPVIYGEKSTAEEDVQRALEDGTFHYPTTSFPGEKGNVAIFGHSSNNILNRGKYKFAFVLLSRLEEGDTFILTKDNKRYVYRVYKKHVVNPTEIKVLDTQDKPSTATLITCDPPGTSLKRLVVVGEQISPDPASNKASHTKPDTKRPKTVPGNAPSLWERLTGWISN